MAPGAADHHSWESHGGVRVKAGIYCRGCWYDLRGIESRQCPECGLDFDPAQPGSFVYYPGTRLPDEIWSVLYIQGTAILLLIVGIVLSKIDKRVAGIETDMLSIFPFSFVPFVQLAAMITSLIAVPLCIRMVMGRKRVFLLLIGFVPWVIAAGGALVFWFRF